MTTREPKTETAPWLVPVVLTATIVIIALFVIFGA